MEEKEEILKSTYTQLKLDIHSRKQMHKMKILSKMLKKRRKEAAKSFDELSPPQKLYQD